MFFEVILLVGFVAVASNPSPYYAALGLVVGAGSGCLMLINEGMTFLSLVLFLVYLGGMMVVFAYSAALVAEPYPEAWGSVWVLSYIGSYLAVLSVGWLLWGEFFTNEKVFDAVMFDLGGGLSEWWGVSGVFAAGGWVLFVGGWALLLTLFVALEVVRGHYSGALRAV
uniref:NADH-ubiquinone oxidoreductase chain 6 n=1 Tax=Microhyla fissipes TaxID=387934 RepID=A0A5J6M2C7_9NEOB|nr:NADH dehydrogenase subunit 6 [Microhyla fissipes]QEW86420.1 NADH dehydrogenase subunit 6 [Microhyla fissipes]QNS22532.1 NADH dehydrogenase subunit 6 [Microhyla fissipes]